MRAALVMAGVYAATVAACHLLFVLFAPRRSEVEDNRREHRATQLLSTRTYTRRIPPRL